MPVRRRRPHLAWLRTLLLLALAAVVLGVVGLFLFGRAGQRRAPPQVAEEAAQATEGTVLVGRDFDYTYTEGKRPLFHIRGESIRANRAQTIFLDGVALTLYDPEGHAYKVASKVASFNQAANEGELSGDVHLTGPNGLDFRSDVLQIAEKGRLLFAPKPVRIRFLDRYVATATSLRFHLEQDLYVLSGKVVVKSTPDVQPPVFMRSEQLVYERPRRLVRIEGKAFLARGGDQLTSGRINGYLTDDEKGLSFVRAIWNVAGSVNAETREQGRTRLNFTSDDLAVLMQADDPRQPLQPRQLELDSGRPKGVVLRAVGGGVTRVLTAKRVVARMANGALESANAFRGVEVRESAARGKPERRLTGEQADLGFQPNGQIGAVDVTGGVHFTDGDLAATGDRGRMDYASGRGEFFGNPADVRSSRGHLVAPHIVYTRGDSLLHADGSVRATLEEKADPALGASLPGGGEGPVRVESKEAFWRERPRSFLFRGDVRAWRGESVLTARDLRGDEEGSEAGKVTATAVKSLWVPAPVSAKAPAAPAAAAGTPAAQGERKQAGPRQPIEVTAAQLVYARPAAAKSPAGGTVGKAGTGLITYTGDVRVEQEGRTLLCQRLDVTLGPRNRAETMTCTGQVRLTDPQGGRTIEGERAFYRLAERVVEVFGDPVTMRDKDGNQVRGRRLVYHVEDGRVEVKGQGAPAPVGAGGEV